jgi:hypothetical protein
MLKEFTRPIETPGDIAAKAAAAKKTSTAKKATG